MLIVGESQQIKYILSYISKKPGKPPTILGFFDIWDNLFFNFNMAWKITPINMDMIDDGYTISEAMVYSRLWRLSHHVDWADILYPSQERIAKDLRMDSRHVRRCLDVLEKYGLIEISRRWYKRRNNYYVVDLNKYPCSLEN